MGIFPLILFVIQISYSNHVFHSLKQILLKIYRKREWWYKNREFWEEKRSLEKILPLVM